MANVVNGPGRLIIIDSVETDADDWPGLKDANGRLVPLKVMTATLVADGGAATVSLTDRDDVSILELVALSGDTIESQIDQWWRNGLKVATFTNPGQLVLRLG